MLRDKKERLMIKQLMNLLLICMSFSVLLLSLDFNYDVDKSYCGLSELIVNSECNQEYFANLESSKRVFDEIMDNYRTDIENTNDIVYIDSFAGVWFCHYGNLNIGTTNRVRASEKGTNATYHVHRFSHNFLLEVHGVIEGLMPNYSIFSVAILSRYNQVEIRLVYEEYIFNIMEHLIGLAIWEYPAVRFVIDNNRPIAIGTPIHSGTAIFGSRMNGTISAKAICNLTGQRGVIANAHIATTHCNQIVSQNRVLGVRARGQMAGTTDAAFVQFANQDAWEYSSSAFYRLDNANSVVNRVVPTTYIVESRNNIVEGLPVAKFGANTGRTEGRIDAIRVSVAVTLNYGGSSIVRTFTDQIRHTAESRNGDSGSPLFVLERGRYVLAGIVFSAVDNVWSPAFANKITNVTQALNVSVMAYNDTIHFTGGQTGPNNWQRLVSRQVQLTAGQNRYFRFSTATTTQFTIQGLGRLDTIDISHNLSSTSKTSFFTPSSLTFLACTSSTVCENQALRA